MLPFLLDQYPQLSRLPHFRFICVIVGDSARSVLEEREEATPVAVTMGLSQQYACARDD